MLLTFHFIWAADRNLGIQYAHHRVDQKIAQQLKVSCKRVIMVLAGGKLL